MLSTTGEVDCIIFPLKELFVYYSSASRILKAEVEKGILKTLQINGEISLEILV